MRVTISVKGRFHAFYLARELQLRGFLERLITSYPAFETVKYGVERKRICSLVAVEVADRLWRRVPRFLTGCYDPQYLLLELFDSQAARNISPGTDLFVGWSALSLRSLREAKRLGAATLLERSSTHMLHQCEVLAEEYARWGMEPKVAHPRVVDKELAEYEEADFVSIPSTQVKRSFLKYGFPEERLIQVPFGVDLDWFYPVAKRDQRFRVIHCGTLSLRKGVQYLVRAFSELRLPDAELWLVGPVANEIKPFLRRFDSPGIVTKGAFRESVLREYYSQGSVFCLASVEEGQAMVLLQAMACGLPVICTTSTGGADIVAEGKEGFVVAPRDVEALKEKILYCYEHRESCREMGKRAREKVESELTWAHYAERMVRQYRRIMQAAGRVGGGTIRAGAAVG